ncbi:hypothetical protein GCM10010168_03710 [Actinoplanes ianthinogenes]|uniref:Uncharacterized protein n=1 Tax=Actinoplanes ianthinogenes TaxID=122358 RepID=A0ABN6CEV8_9ACTN|nr:hypothetical protein [Actinoplanes ianthinogenes]BCJ42889.1 hypothetical protein Aiant_35460 [Actinoplanes ianthinogenes]GGQ91582.1 hypothetical protein GCM10010168_03710 [Actinoplanes ianthinogenes]
MIDESERLTIQPLYLLCDVAGDLTDRRRATIDLLLAHLAEQLTADPELAAAVRWSVELHTGADDLVPLVQLQQADAAVRPPRLTTTATGPARLAAALLAVRRLIRSDITMLEDDTADVRPPCLVVIAAGRSADEPHERAAALDTLLTRNLHADQTRDWAPRVLVVALPGADFDLLAGLGAGRDVEIALAGADDTLTGVAFRVVTAVRRALGAGAPRVAYDRWVVPEHSLVLGYEHRHAPLTDVHPAVVPGVTDPDRRPLVYRRFLDPDQPFAPLLRMVALREHATELTGRMLWPLRLVVGDGATAVTGLLAPDIPDRFRDRRLLGAPPEHRELLRAAVRDLVALAHRHDVRLGGHALDSVHYRLTPTVELLVTDCDAVRVREPGDPAWDEADLAWLAGGAAAEQGTGRWHPSPIQRYGQA